MKNYQPIELSERRKIAFISLLGTTQLHLRNPYVIAWWSAAFPGLGHLLLSKYIRGFTLFLWEILINYNAHINLSIFYSLTGNFEMARQVIDIRWVLLYIPTFIFSFWDVFRTTVDMNSNYILASREDAVIKPFIIGSMEINYLDKRKPWVSAIWSIVMPGMGQLYIHRLITAFFILAWWITIMYQSKFLMAIHFTLLGDFEQAKSIVDLQWVLNIPSIYLFGVYDAYVNTVENNKLFDWEQSKFLKRNYKNKSFNVPSKRKNKVGDKMNVVASFEHSKYLELAITAIEMKGIDKKDILAIPLDKKGESTKLFDTIHSADGLSLFDLPCIIGCIFMLFGCVYGIVLTWGPIIWGFIGLFTGFSFGLIIKLFIVNKFSDGERATRQLRFFSSLSAMKLKQKW